MRPIIVTTKTALLLILLTQIFGVGMSQAQSSNFIGSWRVEITFANGERRSLHFEAQSSGKGSLLPIVSKPNQGGLVQPSTAEWTQSDDHSVMFSGPVQFPLGNVGLERGTVVLKGHFETEHSISGEAIFFPVDQDPKDPKSRPSKGGTFKATRATG